jgi:3-methyl-2-oxobutanoate hydroxymethyltransferase
MPAVTINTLATRKRNHEKFAVITAYDATFARAANAAAIEVILIGDSLGNVLQGQGSTVPVTMDDMCYHTQCVARGNSDALLMADMPFASYDNPTNAVRNAARLMQAGAHMVKLEGGAWLTEIVSQLVRNGIPVCAHLGLLPQSVNVLGGYRVQGRESAQAKQMLDDAIALQNAGASIVLMECVPNAVGKAITEALHVPTVGIGAGPYTDSQVLVLHDMLGLNPKPAKFVRNFMQGSDSIQSALRNYKEAVINGSFPGPEHCFE